MRLRLSQFSQTYSGATKHWYIFPRAQYFNEDNLKEFHTVLTFFQKDQYIKVKDLPIAQMEFFHDLNPHDLVLREWTTETKRSIQKQMIDQGIIKPRAEKKQSLADHLANIRNHINLFKKLGLAYFNKQKHLFISPSGERFLAATEADWPELLENQLVKLQFHNPSLERHVQQYQQFRIFPYLFTLKLILSLRRRSLDVDEFTLFVTPTTDGKDADIERVRSMIEDFRSLSKEARTKIVNHANITMPHITNSIVSLGLFGCTPTLTFKKNRLILRNTKRARWLVENLYTKMRFIEYVRFEDWFKYVGDTRFEIPSQEIIEYYVDTGQTEKAQRVVSCIDDIREKKSLDEILDKLFKERLLEEALEKNPSALEYGLVLVKNGRQFPTDVSNIDLLMQDMDNHYVVVELKKGKTEDNVVGQTLRYMGWIRQNLSKAKVVKGIIVIAKGEVTTKLEMAIKGLQDTQQLIRLKEVPITVGSVRDVSL